MDRRYLPVEKCQLAPDIPSLIKQVFAKLEAFHGSLLVSHALGYITVAKQGLSR